MTGDAGRAVRIIRCPACQRYYRVAATPPAPGTRLRCGKCGEVFTFGAAPAPRAVARPAAAARRARVLIATDGPEFLSLVGEVLDGAGFEQRQAGSGDEAWEAIGAWRPQVILLDVGLPGTPAFELCERLRAKPALAATGIILIASVFQHTRYKRAPTSLYGADDYIEKHHIRDRLLEKIIKLLRLGDAAHLAPAPGEEVARADAPPLTSAPVSALEKEALVREELPAAPRGRQRQGLERLQESLRRFARIIVSDIALYNQDLVERGIREGTFAELLARELDEGRQLYLTRVPAGAADAAYFEDAVRDFIAGRSAGRGVPPSLSRGRGGHGRA